MQVSQLWRSCKCESYNYESYNMSHIYGSVAIMGVLKLWVLLKLRNFNPRDRIDHIFVSIGIKILNC